MPKTKTRKQKRRAAHQPRRLRQIPPQSEAFLGKLNHYHCGAGHVVVTVDRDPGVTPAFMQCRHVERRGFPAVVVECDLRSSSAWYRVPQVGQPSHEWYRPDDDERRTLDSYSAEHVDMGGLLIRPVTDQRAAEGRS